VSPPPPQCGNGGAFEEAAAGAGRQPPTAVHCITAPVVALTWPPAPLYAGASGQARASTLDDAIQKTNPRRTRGFCLGAPGAWELGNPPPQVNLR